MKTVGALLFAFAIAFYFLPSLIAGLRGAARQWTIFFINLVFGWTILGWIAALVWAIVEQPAVPKAPRAESPG